MTQRYLWIAVLLTFIVTVQSPSVLAETPSQMHLIEAQEWKKAERAWNKDARKLAGGDQKPDEREIVGQMLVERAAIAAGRDKARHADWYLWTAGLFGDIPSLDQLKETYGEVGEKLLSMVRPPAEPLPDPDWDAGEFVRSMIKEEKGSRTKLYHSACTGEKGFVTFRAQTDERGYFRAPSAHPNQPLTARPLCVLAVLESYRDRQTEGGEGRQFTINHRLEVQKRR